MTVFVTGGTGFIGRHVVARLSAAAAGSAGPVRILTRQANLPQLQNAEYVHGDLRDINAWKDALDGVEIIYHLAAQLNDSDSEILHTINVQGTLDLLQAASDADVKRLVFASSTGIYGQPSRDIWTEKSLSHPNNLYEKSKGEAEALVLRWGTVPGRSAWILRPSNVFGEEHPRRHLLTLMQQIRDGRFRFVDKERAMVNYVYVEDVADAFARATDIPPGAAIVNTPTSLVDFVAEIAQCLNISAPRANLPAPLAWAGAALLDGLSRFIKRKFPLTRAKVRALSSRAVYDNAYLRAHLLGFPAVGWQEGLRRTVNYYQKQGWL